MEQTKNSTAVALVFVNQAFTNWLLLKILDFFNSFLGSLSMVIPAAEQLKEFKDMLHLQIEYQEKLNPEE